MAAIAAGAAVQEEGIEEACLSERLAKSGFPCWCWMPACGAACQTPWQTWQMELGWVTAMLTRTKSASSLASRMKRGWEPDRRR